VCSENSRSSGSGNGSICTRQTSKKKNAQLHRLRSSLLNGNRISFLLAKAKHARPTSITPINPRNLIASTEAANLPPRNKGKIQRTRAAAQTDTLVNHGGFSVAGSNSSALGADSKAVLIKYPD
jgi:hypothetical protein